MGAMSLGMNYFPYSTKGANTQKPYKSLYGVESMIWEHGLGAAVTLAR